MTDPRLTDITFARATRFTSEGWCSWDGTRLMFVGYWERENVLRVMLAHVIDDDAHGYDWIPRRQPHGARSALDPIIRKAMKEAEH